MDNRQQNLLKIITTEYIKTAQPVSSKFITEAGKFKLSSATIRNEMAELEHQGYIYHPHTSAGRVPTEKGYQFFVDNFLKDFSLPRKQQEILDETLKSFKRFEPVVIKQLAKQMAELSDGTVFVAFAKNDFYYTGLSNLFSQPEFIEQKLVYNLSQVIDHLDLVIKEIYQDISSKVQISIGKQNPFSQDCGSVLTKYKTAEETGIFGILGPIRMDYQNNFSLVQYSQRLINNLK